MKKSLLIISIAFLGCAACAIPNPDLLAQPAHFDYLNWGWEVRAQRIPTARGMARLTVRTLNASGLSNPEDLTDPKEIGKAVLHARNETFSFDKEGNVFLLELPLSRLSRPPVSVEVWDASGEHRMAFKVK
ncbi:MAG: hypothetical protein ACE5H3_03125 [Planctomycetota bacterium]